MGIDHIHFYVQDAKHWKNWFINVMGFQSIAGGKNSHTYTEIMRTGSPKNYIFFIFSSPLSPQSPVFNFLKIHPSGVADVAFRVDNLTEFIAHIQSFVNINKEPIKQKRSAQGCLKWSQIISNTGLIHTLFERQGKTPILPDDWIRENKVNKSNSHHFISLDHLVLNVEKGQLESTVNWYKKILEFEKKQSFTIETPQSGLYSQVMFHPVSKVQFPINEPTSYNSQIQEFLDINRGSGIQHIALRTNNITQVTQQLRRNGLTFLKVPNTYYQSLIEKRFNLEFAPQEWREIMKANILLDQEQNKDHQELNHNNPLLLQIFTQPIFEQPTFFFEIIERRQEAKGFGEGNFQALFEAIEREQIKRGTLNEVRSSSRSCGATAQKLNL